MSVKHTIAWIDIPVKNLERAVAFYEIIMGESVPIQSVHGLAKI